MQRPPMLAFWDTVLDDPLLADLPDDMTFSPRTIELARTQRIPGERAPAPASDGLPRLVGDAGDLELAETVLGEGGMGVVYLAQQRALGREVAVKTLREDAADAERVAALLREANLAGGLGHPNVLPIYALGCDAEGRPLLVMKRVEGHTWSDLLADPAHPLWASERWPDDPLLRNLEILLQVCDAVHFAHDHGVLHRDLKPANIMVGAYGEVYLMDWGLAARVGQAPYSVGGSLPYMAPEMLDGEATEQTDVYLLGAILHELLTGQRLHRGPRLDLVVSISLSEPRDFPTSVPAELAAVCNRATHLEPERRFASVAAFRGALTEFLTHRVSLQLSEAAAAALRELREELRGPDPDRGELERRFAECRFGFRQALEAWSQNRAAREGLCACLELMLERELARGLPAAAAALLAERTALDPEPRERLAAWRRRVEARQQDSEKLRRLVTDLDASVSRRERTQFFLLAIVLTLLFMAGLSTALRRELLPLSDGLLIGLPLLALGAVGGALYVLRRSLLANAFNRRIMYTLLLVIVGILFHRLVALRLGLPYQDILTTDMAMGTVLLGGAGIWIDRRVFILAGVGAVGTVIAALAPAHVIALVFGTSAVAALLGLLLILRGQPQEPPL